MSAEADSKKRKEPVATEPTRKLFSANHDSYASAPVHMVVVEAESRADALDGLRRRGHRFYELVEDALSMNVCQCKVKDCDVNRDAPCRMKIRNLPASDLLDQLDDVNPDIFIDEYEVTEIFRVPVKESESRLLFSAHYTHPSDVNEPRYVVVVEAASKADALEGLRLRKHRFYKLIENHLHPSVCHCAGPCATQNDAMCRHLIRSMSETDLLELMEKQNSDFFITQYQEPSVFVVKPM